MNTLPTHPVLSCDEARALEAQLFGGDEAKEWSAMQRAGRAVAEAVGRDFQEIGGFPADGHVLVLVGKGHNGGDALIAAHTLLERHPQARADVVFVYGERSLRPLAQRAWQELVQSAHDRVDPVAARVSARTPLPAYALSLDGLFGFQFRPPLDEHATAALRRANALPIRLRAAVDLPSGLDAPDAFRADFTYATGSVKSPLLTLPHAGRLRYLDLGFFDDTVAGVVAPGPGSASPATNQVLTSAILAPLSALRSPLSDKRTYGHLFVLGGSREYPGAVLMSVLAALRSGVGLVTAFVPESLVAAYAARAPEAMWVGWPETPEGHLSLDGQYLLRARLERATALAIGPGLGREPETLTLIADVVKNSPVPLVLDADALQPEIVRAGTAARVLTPHAGEFARIAGGKELKAFCAETRATVVLKGPVTRIGSGENVYHSFFGGPVLARGGSGDLLSGLIGGLLAQTPAEPLLAAARGVVWHGMAADALARAHGQTAVQTTQLLDYLPQVLREDQP